MTVRQPSLVHPTCLVVHFSSLQFFIVLIHGEFTMILLQTVQQRVWHDIQRLHWDQCAMSVDSMQCRVTV